MSDEHTNPSVADELEKLTELWTAGAISQKEFAEAKRQVLGLAGTGGARTLLGRPEPGDAPLPVIAKPSGLVETPLEPLRPAGDAVEIISSGEVRLGNLQGREDPPPIPPPKLESSNTIEIDPEVDAVDESEPDPDAALELDIAPEPDPDAALELDVVPGPALDAQSGLAVDPQSTPAPKDSAPLPSAVVGHARPMPRPTSIWSYAPWIIGAAVLGAAVLWIAVILLERSESKKQRSTDLPGRGYVRLSSPVGKYRQRASRGVKWRPAGALSCRALQDRLDDCESVWISRLEGELRAKGMGLATERISVGQPRVAIAQAQALVFDSGGLHRCQAAQQRKSALEKVWLQKTKACMKLRGCKAFSACHVNVFLKLVGRIPFHCQAYCNREMFSCGHMMVSQALVKTYGPGYRLTHSAFDKLQPKFHRNCLNVCTKKWPNKSTRDKLLECIFQPSCRQFAKCVDAVPELN